MRYPFEDIAAANAATRLAYHYDRAGILGGCLTSGMGWREAAVLLKGFGKLPRMLVHARIVTALLGVASLPLILQGPVCFATPMIVICGLVSTVWHVCITILGLSKLKVLGDRRRWQKQVATFERKMSQRVSATTIVFVVEFMLFTFAAASGFAGIVMYHIEKTSLAAATLTLLNAILAILGPVLAAHTAWMGNDLDALTPDLEKLHAHIKHHDREKTRSFHASFRSSFRQGVAVGMSAAVAASVEQTTETVKDNASFRQGSAKQSSMGGIDVTSLSDATNEAESGEAFAVPSRLRRASVAQDLLRVSGAWGVVNLFNRGLGIVLALIAASMWLLGSASALEVFAGLFGFALILLNGLHLCFDLRMRYAVQYRKLVAKFCGGDAENFATDSARELARVQDTPPVILCWKNQTPGRVMLVIETAALILVILTISRANSIPSSSLHPCAVAGTVLFICLVPVQSAALVFSYMACFGYAGGEIEVPKDRLAVLMRNVTAQHNRQSTRELIQSEMGTS
ncbi:Hypothetical Protein FCC1311_105822 [Hondaea fermentalgiana]|uniref:Uncharacterized protein n=1 Tax=Hondaea fermentalgiana TaxID=2315210 RepID=A0A2R5GVK5_9STRA|nr:Hypothetical Protein FCC1311_105822 [Hondaea fermentalgiana]|eukprot:GBG34359.1 Hypothetical Protein FCC1311_105822 [Hondaea fermentalgiana]